MNDGQNDCKCLIRIIAFKENKKKKQSKENRINKTRMT